MSVLPQISVIVRTRDRLPSLRQALQSLRAQTFRDFEVVVVDDGDAPLAPALVEGEPEAPLRVIRQDALHGRSRALNTGLRAARGRFVAYLDDDDLYLPDHLAVLHSFLTSSNGLRAVYSDALLVRQVSQPGGGYLDSAPVPIFGQDFERSSLLFSNFIPLLCLVHETSLAAEAGFVDEGLDLFEDWDFLIRASRVTPFVRVPRATALYRVRDDGTNATTRMPWLGPESEAQRQRILAKHLPEITPGVILDYLNSQEARWDHTLRRNGDLEKQVLAATRTAEDLRQELERSREETALQARLLAEARQELVAASERERVLMERVENLEKTVHQMATSLAWRLFTPYWKLKEYLERGR